MVVVMEVLHSQEDILLDLVPRHRVSLLRIFDDQKLSEIVVILSGTHEVAVLTEYTAAEFAKQIVYSTGATPQTIFPSLLVTSLMTTDQMLLSPIQALVIYMY